VRCAVAGDRYRAGAEVARADSRGARGRRQPKRPRACLVGDERHLLAHGVLRLCLDAGAVRPALVAGLAGVPDPGGPAAGGPPHPVLVFLFSYTSTTRVAGLPLVPQLFSPD